jgi:hypothetical protein
MTDQSQPQPPKPRKRRTAYERGKASAPWILLLGVILSALGLPPPGRSAVYPSQFGLVYCEYRRLGFTHDAAAQAGKAEVQASPQGLQELVRDDAIVTPSGRTLAVARVQEMIRGLCGSEIR